MIEVRATTRPVRDPQASTPYSMQPCVEVWIGGVRFVNDCTSAEEARVLALRIARDLGVGR